MHCERWKDGRAEDLTNLICENKYLINLSNLNSRNLYKVLFEN